MDNPACEVEVCDDTGKLTGRFQLVDGRLHGTSTMFSEGRVIAEICYAQGLRHGEMRSYGDSGQLSSVVQHAADLVQGEACYYHPNGALARRANYQGGRLHGEVCDYAPDGELVSRTLYIDGKLQPPPAGSAAGDAAGKSAGSAPPKSWLARLVEG